MKEFYRRHLPHWQPRNAVFFVTFRLKNFLNQNESNKITWKHNDILPDGMPILIEQNLVRAGSHNLKSLKL